MLVEAPPFNPPANFATRPILLYFRMLYFRIDILKCI
jgi:hypothetical protein